MAIRPTVTVDVVDNSFIVDTGENASAHISGMYSLASPNLLDVFGTTLERNAEYMTIPSLGEWLTRLDGTTFGGTGSGPTGAWVKEWYSAYNYLLYGGILSITDSSTKFYDATVDLDTVFAAELIQAQSQWVSNVTGQRDDIIGIIGVTFHGYTGGSVPSNPTLTPLDPSASERIFIVGGEKTITQLQKSNATDTTFVDISLASDVAGCFARTDSITNPWYSPAGTRRGRILNIVKLIFNPSSTDQDRLYSTGVNSVIGVPGQGTFLFGDITNVADQTSTLSRVNVVRLINYIKKTLGNTARSVLFEVNDEITRNSFRSAANGFLQTIKDGRGLYEYRVICDESNNPGSVVDANRFVADVYIKPTKSINYVRIRITNLNTDAEI